MKDRRFLIGFMSAFALIGFSMFSMVTLSFLLTAAGSGRTQNGNIAVVKVNGVIHDSQKTVDALKKYAENKKVKAIVLRVDSPGGEVGPSQEMHDQVKKISKDKPVVASLGSVAASGGYYISCAASKIVANPGTTTGSIGVIMGHYILKDIADKMLLRWEIVKSGQYKDMASPLRNLTVSERKLIQGIIQNLHAQFVKAVAEGRSLKVEQVMPYADGRVYTGEQAKEYKLVDELGGLEHAIEIAAKLGKVEGDPKVIYPDKHKKWYLEHLMERAVRVAIDQLRIQSRLRFLAEAP